MADQRRVLPKDALSHVVLGHTFAENDPVLLKPRMIVRTPAIKAASSADTHRCIFVGRRGTGKTAITRYLEDTQKNICLISPHTFGQPTLPMAVEDFMDMRKRPFNSLMQLFHIAISAEVVAYWKKTKAVKEYEIVGDVKKESEIISAESYDERILLLKDEFSAAITDEKKWTRFNSRAKNLQKGVESLQKSTGLPAVSILVDRIDDDWDGSQPALIWLAALFHAAVTLSSTSPYTRLKIFVRENVFERAREIDNEFARLETWVYSLDWSREYLLEFVERRLLQPFTTWPKLGGDTWSEFFESSNEQSSFDIVLRHCSMRPRDILTYCDYAIENAKQRKHLKVSVEDLLSARSKFSDSRLKDLGDEYAENYPGLYLVLKKFFGLTKRIAYTAMSEILRALLDDDTIKVQCKRWIYANVAPLSFCNLLFNIGFVGVVTNRSVDFRGSGWLEEGMSPVGGSSVFEIHSAFADALQLRDDVLVRLDEGQLRDSGIIEEVGITIPEFYKKLDTLQEGFDTLPCGLENASEFENLVVELIKICFAGKLDFVEVQVTTIGGTQRRDIIAANVAPDDFWEAVRSKWSATQVVFECKNYEQLKAADFQQVGHYLDKGMTKCAVLCCRASVSEKYWQEHLRDLYTAGKMVIILTAQDTRTLIRQARSGKSSDRHLWEKMSAVERHNS